MKILLFNFAPRFAVTLMTQMSQFNPKPNNMSKKASRIFQEQALIEKTLFLSILMAAGDGGNGHQHRRGDVAGAQRRIRTALLII